MRHVFTARKRSTLAYLQLFSWAMRGAKRLPEWCALAKHSSEDYHRSGKNYFRSGYLCIYLSDWHWLKYAFSAWLLRTYMANWEKVESSVWCQIIGNLLIYATFFSVSRYIIWLTLYKLIKKSFQVFASKITFITIEAKKLLEKFFCLFNTDKLYTFASVQSNRTHLLDFLTFLCPVTSWAYLYMILYSRFRK